MTRFVLVAVPLLVVLAGMPGGRAGLVREGNPAAEVLALERAWNEAIVTRDADAVAAILADDYRGTDAVGNVTDKATYLADLKAGVIGANAIDLEEIQVRMRPGVAVLIGRARIRRVGFGRSVENTIRFTATYVRDADGWRCLAYHDSPAPTPTEAR